MGKLESEIKEKIDEYFKDRKFPSRYRIPLASPTIGSEEVNEAIDSLLQMNLTMGRKVLAFESVFKEYQNTRYATMVNSGSSANLVALSILTNPAFRNRMMAGSEVITPATTWATTVFPIAYANCTPVLTDVNLDTFNINPDSIEKAITSKTRAIMPVHLMGNPCDIKEIMEIAEKHNLFVIEDTCEALGAKVDNQRAGNFGDLATFSFFFSHHISTIEGGIVATNEDEFDELSKALRVFGWARDMKKYENYAEEHKDIDKRFLFVNTGFNLRPTEIQGAIGIHQMKKLDNLIEVRRKNAYYLNKQLEPYSDFIMTQKERANTRHTWFGFPITIRKDAPFTRDEMTAFLESKSIETRPIQIPNMSKQPAVDLIKHRVSGELQNSDYIMKNSFWFGIHQGVETSEREYLAEAIISFIERRRKKSATG